MQFWESKKKDFKLLHHLAMEYIPAVATSTASERLFSAAGFQLKDRRNRISPEHAEHIFFLSENFNEAIEEF